MSENGSNKRKQLYHGDLQLAERFHSSLNPNVFVAVNVLWGKKVRWHIYNVSSYHLKHCNVFIMPQMCAIETEILSILLLLVQIRPQLL